MSELVDSSFFVVTIMKYLRQATFFFFEGKGLILFHNSGFSGPRGLI